MNELARQLMPVFMVDKKEPFAIKAIGCTLFTKDERSDSFPKRIISADWEEIGCVIEYAVWFDYDIQHLYELEHVWVYADHAGGAVRVEGSFHGKYLNILNIDSGEPILNPEGRPVVWLQPGKHAVLPDKRLVKLVPEWRESCTLRAGADGVPVPEQFRGWLPALTADEEARVCAYIKEHYAFEPTLEYVPAQVTADLLIPWDKLKQSIPKRLAAELVKIGIPVSEVAR